MAVNKVPTLVLGLGGIGCRIAQEIYDTLTEQERKYVACVGVDTNIEDLVNITIPTVQTSDQRTVGEYLVSHPEYEKWFPVNKFVAGRGMEKGCGQIRAMSRMAMLASVEKGKFQSLNSEISRILTPEKGIDMSSFLVFMVGSITGGTGAGLFLLMPYYLKAYMAEKNAKQNVRIRGMYISADITETVQNGDINRDAVKVNAYACMKELNAFYLVTNGVEENPNIKLEYFSKPEASANKRNALRRNFIEARKRNGDNFDEMNPFNRNEIDRSVKAVEPSAPNPYDAFYLFESSGNGGGIGNAPLQIVEKQVARIVYTMLFTPIKTSMAGAADNYILQDMEKGGMNRYNGAGLCSLKYPYESRLEYVTLRWTKDLVEEEWLYLDQQYENEKKSALSRQAEDPTVRVPKIKDAYVRLFEAEIKGGEGKKLAYLKEQAVRTQMIHSTDSKESKGSKDSKDGKSHSEVLSHDINKTDDFLKNIDNSIRTILEKNKTYNEAKDDCEINENKLRDSDDMVREIRRVDAAMERFRATALALVEEYQFSIADEFFPLGQDAFNQIKKNSKCVFALFKNVHPIVGRYFCYKILLELRKRIDKLEGVVKAKERLNAYKEEDFRQGKEAKDEKMRDMRASQAAQYYIDKMHLWFGRKQVAEVRNEYIGMVEGDVVPTIEKYAKTALSYYTYRLLQTRFEKLAEEYELFFANLSRQIGINKERIEVLERSFEHNPLGTKFVYANQEAFEDTYQKFISSGTVQFELPSETKEVIADKIFTLTYGMMKVDLSDLSENKKEAKLKSIRKAMSNLFNDGIVRSLKKIAREKGNGVINLTIRQALEKEFQMQPEYLPGADDNKDKFKEYMVQQIETAMIKADPMLGVAHQSPKMITEATYLAMNPESAELNAGEPDAGITKQVLVPHRDCTVLLDQAFSQYEMICMRTTHNIVVEELVKYQADGEFAKKYRERIESIGTTPDSDSTDAYKLVVNPHLDRHWAEEGMIPSLTGKEREDVWMECDKAFIYAMGYDLFLKLNQTYSVGNLYKKSERSAGQRWFYITEFGKYAVMKNGYLIERTYADLFDSLRFNGLIRKDILERSKERIMNAANSRVVYDANSIMETVLFTDLSQFTGKEEADENILDIFAKMYEALPQKRWNQLFDGLAEVVTEYVLALIGDSGAETFAAYENAIQTCWYYSEIGKRYNAIFEAGNQPDPVKDQIGMRMEEQLVRILEEIKQ